jgi:hypothetical protein
VSGAAAAEAKRQWWGSAAFGAAPAAELLVIRTAGKSAG